MKTVTSVLVRRSDAARRAQAQNAKDQVVANDKRVELERRRTEESAGPYSHSSIAHQSSSSHQIVVSQIWSGVRKIRRLPEMSYCISLKRFETPLRPFSDQGEDVL
jgi:hypothetical protein